MMTSKKDMGKTVRQALLCGVALFALGTVAAHAESFDLPAQPAVTSIPMFARQAGIQIVAPTDQLGGITTPALRGALDRKAALHQLLKGTPLVVASDDGTTVVLRVADKTTHPAEPHTAPAPAPVSAADDSATVVVVKGFKDSLKTAQDNKRRAVGTVDVIVSDDIAAFPDLNLAESLQRIPGITITRDAGEGRQIALRGLGADFTRTQLNGMEVLTNTASGMDNRGGVTRSRSFDYSMFASELFDKVTVDKSFSADQDEGGIGGTVQLETAKPFDYHGFEAALTAKAQYNTNVDNKVTPRLVGLISNRWGDFGALLSVAYSENDSNEYGYRDYGWGQIHANAANVGAGVDAATAARLEATDNTRLFAPQSDTYSTWYTHRTRVGATLALQWEPSDTFKMGLDGLYSKLNNQRHDYSLTTSGTNSLTGNLTGTQVVQSAVVEGNTLISATYSGVDLRTEENLDNDSTVFGQLGVHASWHPTDKLSFTALVGTSKSEYAQPVFDKVFLESPNHTETVDDRPTMPFNVYGGASLTDPASWQLMRMDTQEASIVTKYDNAKIDGKYKFSDTQWLTAGVSYKKFDNGGYTYVNKVFHNTVVGTTSTDTVIPGSMKGLVPYQTLGQYIVGDVNQVYPLIGQTRDLNASFLSTGSNYHETEKTDAFYIQYNLDKDIFGYRVRANAGERYYKTDLESAGFLNSNSGGLQPVDVKHTYDGWLPALNIAVDLTPSLVARFDANRDVSRPALGDMAATGTITTAPFGGSLSVGNPDLKPFQADSIEGSLEYYQGKSGYASIGFFWKNMKQWISTTTFTEPYSATGYPDSLLVQGETPATIFNVSSPVNEPYGKIKGIEIAYQRDFDFLPGAWRHLGFVGNATYADGEAPATISGVTYNLPLSNLSKYTANATLYYETPVWDVRISDVYRDKYLDGIGSAGNVGDFIAATNNVDFAAHYKITPKLKLVLEGINLTNQHIIQYVNGIGGDGVKRTEVNTSAGTTYTLGLTYAF